MTIKPLTFCAIAFLYCTTLYGTAIARPLDESEQQVENQIQQAIKTASTEGYQLLIPRNVGRLTRGAEAPKTLLLYPNREYSFVAVCDRNCNEVNLIVKDMNGNRVASDTSGNAVAVVNLKPPSENRYQVNVRMAKCSARSCNFGLGVFSKR
jgi:hypothetical protein